MSRQKDCLENYELHKLIGRGAFGDVRIAKNKATSNSQII
jgi:serine/threonine protein kinase